MLREEWSAAPAGMVDLDSEEGAIVVAALTSMISYYATHGVVKDNPVVNNMHVKTRAVLADHQSIHPRGAWLWDEYDARGKLVREKFRSTLESIYLAPESEKWSTAAEKGTSQLEADAIRIIRRVSTGGFTLSMWDLCVLLVFVASHLVREKDSRMILAGLPQGQDVTEAYWQLTERTTRMLLERPFVLVRVPDASNTYVLPKKTYAMTGHIELDWNSKRVTDKAGVVVVPIGAQLAYVSIPYSGLKAAQPFVIAGDNGAKPFIFSNLHEAFGQTLYPGDKKVDISVALAEELNLCLCLSSDTGMVSTASEDRSKLMAQLQDYLPKQV